MYKPKAVCDHAIQYALSSLKSTYFFINNETTTMYKRQTHSHSFRDRERHKYWSEK